MAYLQTVYFSNSLMRRTQLTVILPVDHPASEQWPDHSNKPYKTLYLLHGIFGDCMSWPAHSRIQRYAEDRNLCFIMPSGENGFYLDHSDSYDNYASMIKELVEVTRRMFPLSHKREDTFIGGFSMGGFGALRNGLKYHDIFGSIVAMSAPFLLEAYAAGAEMGSPVSTSYLKAMFGDPKDVLESDKNPDYLVDTILKQGSPMPKLYISCGVDDGLLVGNEAFVSRCKAKGVEITYETDEGGHDWDFWDSQMKHVINDWLEVEPSLGDLTEKIIAH